MRKWIESVEEYPALQPERWYRLRVVSIEKDRTRRAILIDLEHLGGDQAGRRHSGAALGLPVRPAGLTADFFRAACGQDAVAVGKAIAPKDALDAILLARFAASPDHKDWQPVAFRQHTEGK